MPPARMTPELFQLVAERFRALGEPARLRILYALRNRERSVGDLAIATGLAQANLSRHLGYLRGLGLVTRRKHGLFALYALAGRDVLDLCDAVCGRLQRERRGRRGVPVTGGTHRG